MHICDKSDIYLTSTPLNRLGILCMYVCMCACMYVYMHACIYVCMYALSSVVN